MHQLDATTLEHFLNGAMKSDEVEKFLKELIIVMGNLVVAILDSTKQYIREELTQLLIHKETLTVVEYTKVQTYSAILQILK